MIRVAALALVLLACGPKPIPVAKQQVTVACGTCIFKIENSKGCYWAAELDGTYYPVTGSFPTDHDSHAPEGMCNMARQAVVQGEIRGKLFAASQFELLDASDEEVPEKPRYTPKDIH